jgi:hypothetical protein
LREFNGQKLKMFSISYQLPCADTWHWLCAIIMDALYSTIGDPTQAVMEMYRWDSAWIAAIAKLMPHSIAIENTTCSQQYFCSPAALSGVFPLPLAMYLNGIGPVVCRGRVCLPGRFQAESNIWHYNLTHGSSPILSTNSPNRLPLNVLSLSTAVLLNTPITLSWSNSMMLHKYPFMSPINLLSDIWAQTSDKIQSRSGYNVNLDLFVHLTAQSWGGPQMLAKANVINDQREIRPLFGDFSWYYGVLISSVGCPVQLYGSDAMKAILFCPYINRDDDAYVKFFNYCWKEEQTPEAQFANIRSFVERTCRSNQKLQKEFADYEEYKDNLNLGGPHRIPVAKSGSSFAETYANKILVECSVNWGRPSLMSAMIKEAIEYGSLDNSDFVYVK